MFLWVKDCLVKLFLFQFLIKISFEACCVHHQLTFIEPFKVTLIILIIQFTFQYLRFSMISTLEVSLWLLFMHERMQVRISEL